MYYFFIYLLKFKFFNEIDTINKIIFFIIKSKNHKLFCSPPRLQKLKISLILFLTFFKTQTLPHA